MLKLSHELPISQSEPVIREPGKISEVKEVAKQFESLMMHEVFKAMRRTVEAAKADRTSQGESVFTSMLDEKLASVSANSGSGGGQLAKAVEDQLLRSVLPHASPLATRVLTNGEWVRPVGGEVGRLSSGQVFGAVREGNRPDECGSGHCGIDLARITGTPVVSVSDGVIAKVANDPYSYAGLRVSIRHAHGKLETRYMHLHEIREDLKPGMKVKAGEFIGTVGNTGTSSKGAHLHFELYDRSIPNRPKYLDPKPYLEIWDGVKEVARPKIDMAGQINAQGEEDSVDNPYARGLHIGHNHDHDHEHDHDHDHEHDHSSDYVKRGLRAYRGL